MNTGAGTPCHDCGGPHGVVTCTDGSKICLSCQEKRSDALNDQVMAARGQMSMMAPIDLDSPPVQCNCQGCARDATWITKVYSATHRGLIGITACDEHIPGMQTAAIKLGTNS